MFVLGLKLSSCRYSRVFIRELYIHVLYSCIERAREFHVTLICQASIAPRTILKTFSSMKLNFGFFSVVNPLIFFRPVKLVPLNFGSWCLNFVPS